MNMERIEERCLAFLKQAQNPLVPVEQLLEYCRQEEDAAGLSTGELLTFLRGHGDVQVLEGPEDHEAVNLQLFVAAGAMMGPRVILYSRIPSPQEMTAILAAQLATMSTTLGETLVKAQEAGDNDRVDQIREALAQAEELRTRLKLHVAHEGK